MKPVPKRNLRRRPTTVYFDPEVARAVKLKAVEMGMSVSDQVNEALLCSLREDESDLRVFKERGKEPVRDYEGFLREMKRDGLL